MTKYRNATPQEIADCIRRQVVDACDLANTDEYKTKPTKLLALIRDIKTAAISNADWLASQRPVGGVINDNENMLHALQSIARGLTNGQIERGETLQDLAQQAISK